MIKKIIMSKDLSIYLSQSIKKTLIDFMNEFAVNKS